MEESNDAAPACFAAAERTSTNSTDGPFASSLQADQRQSAHSHVLSPSQSDLSSSAMAASKIDHELVTGNSIDDEGVQEMKQAVSEKMLMIE